ncbi:MAG: hypothetical protein GX605_11360, partial [Chloroflexi bacterium]|nr:hypothetical protein [Chloroflexota bacterium]
GLLAAAVYLYTPYHLLDLYVRSSLAEFSALAALPWAFWAFTALAEEGGARRTAWAALGFAVLLLTHNATALMGTPLLAAWVLAQLLAEPCRRAALQRAGWALGAAALGVGLAGFFIAPMLAEQRFVQLGQWTGGSYSFLKHFVYPSQLLSPFWGFGYAGEGTADAMSFQLGLAPLVGFAVVCIWGRRLHPGRSKALFLALATMTVVFFMLPASAPLWQALPLAALVQFPWRLLALTTLTLAALSGAAPRLLAGAGGAEARALLPAALLAVLLAGLPYAQAEHTPRDPRTEQAVAVIDFETFSPLDRVGMTVWVEEQPLDSPLVAQYLGNEPLTKARVLAGQGQVETIHYGGERVTARVQADGPLTLQFLTYYFPGWHGWVDGQQTPLRPEGPQGLIALEVPSGDHQVEIRLGNTPARSAGLILSAGSGIMWLGLLAASRPRKGGGPIVAMP